jgi:hypothetical protein
LGFSSNAGDPPTMAVHNPRILNRWRTIFAEWKRSGLSAAAFCRSRGFHKSGFYHWRRILRDLEGTATPLKPAPSFVPVRVVPEAIVEVILPSGIQLRVPLGAEVSQVASLAQALGAMPC